jgi:hypothetical protein
MEANNVKRAYALIEGTAERDGASPSNFLARKYACPERRYMRSF